LPNACSPMGTGAQINHEFSAGRALGPLAPVEGCAERSWSFYPGGARAPGASCTEAQAVRPPLFETRLHGCLPAYETTSRPPATAHRVPTTPISNTAMESLLPEADPCSAKGTLSTGQPIGNRPSSERAVKTSCSGPISRPGESLYCPEITGENELICSEFLATLPSKRRHGFESDRTKVLPSIVRRKRRRQPGRQQRTDAAPPWLPDQVETLFPFGLACLIGGPTRG